MVVGKWRWCQPTIDGDYRMTDEELKARIADLEAAVEAAKKDKHDALGEKNKAKAALAEAQKIAEEAAEAQALASQSVEEVKAALEKKHAREIEKLTGQLNAANSTLKTHLVDNAITKALVDNGVPAHYHRALLAQHREGVEVKEGKAIVGDVDLVEHMTGWFNSEEGKHFRPAPANTGTGATGSTKPAENGSAYKKADGSLNHTAFGEFIKTDQAGAKAWAQANGFGDIAKEL
jgi:F0F1-type ATP synthase membrane subunit b/b'